MIDLHYDSLSRVATLLARRELSSVELTRHQLERIARLDSRLHAFALVLPELALAQAREAEQEIARGDYRGPLHGVPIGVKDLCDTAGIRTACGTTVLRDRVPARDSVVVERLRAAGAVILGKLELTEGAYGTHHPAITPPVNPWNESLWTGVSSSGSAVATAAGLCFATLGTDTGGSIRFPAASCSVVGLKPTYGRVPLAGVFPLAPSLDHVGPIVRSVRDAAVLLATLAGFDERDPTSRREAVPAYLEQLESGVHGVRIGIDRAYVEKGIQPEVSRAVLDACDTLVALGATLVDVTMPAHDLVSDAWTLLCATETALVHEATYPSRASEYGPVLRGLIDLARRAPALALARAQEVRRTYTAKLGAVLAQVDLVACPSMPWTPPPAERADASADRLGRYDTSPLRFTAPFSFSGSPTLSLPCGFTSAGEPLSLQLVGRHLDESLLLRAGHAYEQATEWHLRHPSL